jgi:hypothetical protein
MLLIPLLLSLFIPFSGTVVRLMTYLITAETDDSRGRFISVPIVDAISSIPTGTPASATKSSTSSPE